MRLAYVDTSCLVAVAFGEAGAGRVEARLRRSHRLFASNLLEAELRAALAREGVDDRGESLLSGITWIYPDRPLTPEFDRILAVGYLKGADLWHLAHALFLAPAGKGLAFLTLDQRQRALAAELGFAV
ncbi:MAG TPA: PIN domain-containing protein [Candidatus Methylomirabilis sp.]